MLALIKWRLWVRYSLALLSLTIVTLLSGIPAQSIAAAEEQGADVAVTLWAIPTIRVARGTILAYKLRVENHGSATMTYARVHLPYPQSQLTLVDSLFETDKDYVEAVGDTISVYFGSIGKDAARFAVLYMYVAADLPDDTIINMWAGFDWEDLHGNYGINRRSNAAPVLVGSENATSDYVWMAADPLQGRVGTPFYFFSDRFIPGERVLTWLQRADGVRYPEGEGLSGRADGDGRIYVHLDSSALLPGTYQVVLHGKRSRLEAVATITISAR